MLIEAGVFVAVVCMTRFISVSLLAAALPIVLLAFIEGAPLSVVSVVWGASLLIVTRHRSNVARLVAGNERRVGQRA